MVNYLGLSFGEEELLVGFDSICSIEPFLTSLLDKFNLEYLLGDILQIVDYVLNYILKILGLL